MHVISGMQGSYLTEMLVGHLPTKKFLKLLKFSFQDMHFCLFSLFSLPSFLPFFPSSLLPFLLPYFPLLKLIRLLFTLHWARYWSWPAITEFVGWDRCAHGCCNDVAECTGVHFFPRPIPGHSHFRLALGLPPPQGGALCPGVQRIAEKGCCLW